MFGPSRFAVLADHLSRQGIAVLRVDVRAAVHFLAARPDIDPTAIGLIGHSHGGIVGALAAVRGPAVGSLVLLAAPATTMAELLLAQRRMTVAMLGQAGAAPADSEALLAGLFAATAGAPDRAKSEPRHRPQIAKSMPDPESCRVRIEQTAF